MIDKTCCEVVLCYECRYVLARLFNMRINVKINVHLVIIELLFLILVVFMEKERV